MTKMSMAEAGILLRTVQCEAMRDIMVAECYHVERHVSIWKLLEKKPMLELEGSAIIKAGRNGMLATLYPTAAEGS